METPFLFALADDTLLGILAASAPPQPDWFKPEGVGECPDFLPVDDYAKRFNLNPRSIVDDDDAILTAKDHVITEHARGRSMASDALLIKAAAAFRKLQADRQRERYQWRIRHTQESMFQWPLFYAREILKRR